MPGESAGAVKLGMTLEEVEKLWGKSNAEDATLGRRLLTWKDAGAAAPFASIFFTRIGAGHTYVVEQISVHAPQAATPTGIKIGAEIGQKEVAPHAEVKALSWSGGRKVLEAEGIAVQLSDDDKALCIGIVIHRKAVPATAVAALQ